MANSDGWWGEGNDNWYVDGSEKPTISGTGSEDYFCGAWDFGHAFWDPYFGVPYYDNASKGGEKRGILNTCYRWHIQDPVPFKRVFSLPWNMDATAGMKTANRSPTTTQPSVSTIWTIRKAMARPSRPSRTASRRS